MGKITVEVCAGTHCTMMGSMDIIDAVHSLEEIRQEMADACEVEVSAVPCMNLCKGSVHGPFVRVDGQLIEQAENEAVMAAIMSRCQARRTELDT
ncbi:MAG: NAD(P)H-dependent oxidoreductase subunit E [Christensenellales bacterium]